MLEIKDVRVLACRICGYVANLRKDEPDPERCPACQDGETVALWGGKSEGWTA